MPDNQAQSTPTPDTHRRMTASARPVAGGLAHVVDVNGRHALITDEPLTLGGTDRGPAPHELLVATLASCVATMMALYARNRGWDLGSASVDVAYDPDGSPRRFEINLHMPDGLSDEQKRRLERVAATCPVRRALEAGFEFEERTLSPAPEVRAA
ncbi:MAG TPA: OsmC family protein [Solirubrobacteraceae bacterium]|jgi:putative redox protein